MELKAGKVFLNRCKQDNFLADFFFYFIVSLAPLLITKHTGHNERCPCIKQLQRKADETQKFNSGGEADPVKNLGQTRHKK